MTRKPRTIQSKKPNQGRDKFQTPNYATDLLIPFIKYAFPTFFTPSIWEPAYGKGKIVNRLIAKGFTDVLGSDLEEGHDFLNWKPKLFQPDMIITNPPFSLKEEFYVRAKEFDIPFAFLIPTDLCQWILEAMRTDCAQWIIPTRRINYITPTGRQGKKSSSYWHSGWFCYKMNLPQQVNVVDLSLEEIKSNI